MKQGLARRVELDPPDLTPREGDITHDPTRVFVAEKQLRL
jgi:hypothetical protein